MKYSDKSIGDVLKEVFRTYNLEDKLNETKLINSWGAVAGKMVQNHTLGLSIKQKILFIKLDSPALRNELSYSKEKLIKLLNQEVGKEVIEDIVFN